MNSAIDRKECECRFRRSSLSADYADYADSFNKGRQQGGQEPGKGSQEDKQAGQRGGFDPSEGGDGGSYKEGGQNEQNRR